MNGDNSNPFQVAILAGGLATRMRPITEKVPKSLLEVAGKPFIYHQLRLLRANGIKRIVVCLGYLGEQVRDYIDNGNQFGLEVLYSYDGEAPLGTGGALKKALINLSDVFFVLYGDSYLDIDYTLISDVFRKSNMPALMTVLKNENQWDTSNVLFDGSMVLEYNKKSVAPNMQYIDYGLGLLRKELFNSSEFRECFDLADLYKYLAENRMLMGYEVFKRFYEIGSLKGLSETDSYLRGQK